MSPSFITLHLLLSEIVVLLLSLNARYLFGLKREGKLYPETIIMNRLVFKKGSTVGVVPRPD